MSNLLFSQENYYSKLIVFLSRNYHFLEQVASKKKKSKWNSDGSESLLWSQEALLNQTSDMSADEPLIWAVDMLTST